MNIVLNADGSLPPESRTLLAELAKWMAVNGEAIHGTRPWHIYGEGPTKTTGGSFQESGKYTAEDIRFTTKGKTLYAIALGEPRGRLTIASLSRKARRVRNVGLLGSNQSLHFQQTDVMLAIDVPDRLPTRYGSAFTINFA
jgi:alpha-L-fucosidase